MKIHGKKPSQAQYSNWANEVRKAKASLKGQKTMRQNKKKRAIESWQNGTNAERIEMMGKVLKHHVEGKGPDMVVDALYVEIQKEKSYQRLFNYLLGYSQAIVNAKKQGVDVENVKTPNRFWDGFFRKGWMAAKRGSGINLENNLNYLNNPSAVKL
jgi:hypothetical protein